VRITEAEENKGLANSIIQGVKELMSKYDKVIVMEDDLICSLDYLEYMNEALEVYQNNKLIWSISGYTPNLSFPKAFEEQVYLSSRGCSWGWATWKDRWKKVDWGVADFEDFKKDKERREAFNQGGNDLYKLLELHMLGKVDSWAIRWCYSQFKRNTYTVYPVKSKISNHGFNLNGTHNRGKDSRWDVELCSEKIQLPETVSIDKEVFNSFKNYYDLDWVGRSGYFSRKYGFYGFAQKFKRMFRK